MDAPEYSTFAMFSPSHSGQFHNQSYHIQKAQDHTSDILALTATWPGSRDSFLDNDGRTEVPTSSSTTPGNMSANSQHNSRLVQSQSQACRPSFYRILRLPEAEGHGQPPRARRMNDEFEDATRVPPEMRHSCNPRNDSKQRRLPCIYRKCKKRFRYLSQMMRHLKSHGLFACSKCFSTFSTATSADSHVTLNVCPKACADRRCRRHYPPPGPAPATCQHLKSAKQQLKVLYPLQFANGGALDQSMTSSPSHASSSDSNLSLEVPETPQSYSSDIVWWSSNDTIPSTPVRPSDSLVKAPHDACQQQKTEDRLKLLEGRFEKTEKTIGDLKRENNELRRRNHQLTTMLSGQESKSRRHRRPTRTGLSRTQITAEPLAQAQESYQPNTLELGSSSSAFDDDWLFESFAHGEVELRSQNEETSER